MNHRSGTVAMLRQFCFDLDEVREGIGLGFGLGDDSDSMHCEPLPSNGSEMTCLDEVVNIRVVELSTASASRHSGSNASMRRWFVSICFYMARKKCYTVTLIKGALGYAIQLSANSNDVGGGATMFKCNVDPPEFDSNSDPDPDSHTKYVQLGYSVITRSTMSHLTHEKIDESSHMHSEVVIVGSHPAIYLAQANLKWVLFEGFMAHGFTAGGQRTATVNGQEDEEPETADTVFIGTGARAKRLRLKGEEVLLIERVQCLCGFWRAVPIFRNEPSSCHLVADKATCTSCS
ncbi:hypothetical protein K435DRAFT_926767 [Dendrothele bispora CBS 962.96]|uniref:Uncharacterized protein n=1 Tax=Dendrothele bispora (strain CBS 962.96) TaxID=1314807 RepID=A0A4S8MH05_DENBC|nr:hypothetical protein K435DRAFT_926767 [Dendrothele bispora CBS 962.96]